MISHDDHIRSQPLVCIASRVRLDGRFTRLYMHRGYDRPLGGSAYPWFDVAERDVPENSGAMICPDWPLYAVRGVLK